MSLFNFRAPALPLPPDEYNRQQFDEQARALRLYFNRLDSDFTTLINADGGSNLSFPHIAASDSTDQRATANNTIKVINFDTLESSSGWTLNPPGSATSEYPGVFTIRYSLQFANTDNAQHTVTVWIQVNGADVANSATTFSVPARKSPSIPGFTTAYSEATFTVDAGDEVELYFATDKADIVSPAADGIFLFHDAAQVSPFARPAIPSAIGSITFVAALP